MERLPGGAWGMRVSISVRRDAMSNGERARLGMRLNMRSGRIAMKRVSVSIRWQKPVHSTKVLLDPGVSSRQPVSSIIVSMGDGPACVRLYIAFNLFLRECNVIRSKMLYRHMLSTTSPTMTRKLEGVA